ncbi:MAG TPA: hypothetical protein VMF61_15640 [Candidatus Acidoferrales bacterium]|nr:hypothetical protein [Candidatus Acidoferrales bacterium]
MRTLKRFSAAALAAAGIVLGQLQATAATAPAPSGARGFDFDFGTWHTRIRRLAHPFTGAKPAWLTYDGVVTVRPVWGGAASVEEIEADGPSHLELMNVRTYDPQSRQWTLNGAGSSDGTLGKPMYGAFSSGRGVFYGQEFVDGKIALVRQTFFDIAPDSYDFRQAASDDAGATWKPDFVAHLTRTSLEAPSEGGRTAPGASHDFDFNYGTWATQITAGSSIYSGTVAVRKIWDGRALMEEIHAAGSAGKIEGLTLFLYDPQTRQWSQTYADRSDGAFERSAIGGFDGGRGTLVAFPAPNAGTMQCEREVWSHIRPGGHRFEIQFSSDGCNTWKPAFVANLRRVGPGL